MGLPHRLALLLLFLASFATAQDFRPPAEDRPAVRRPGASSILPGGRVIVPLGKQYPTGPGPFGITINANGKTVVTSDGGPNRYALTVVEQNKDGWRTRHLVAPANKDEEEDSNEADWRSVFMGLAFEDDRDLYASEGNSGRVRFIDTRNGNKKQIYDLNQGSHRDSYTGDLAYDSKAQRLYVVDQANFRLAIIDTKAKRIASSVRVGRLPFAMALSPDGKRVWVANLGMFEYKAAPGADPERPRETGLPFPAFGFPSKEALAELGDPNVPESNSVAVVNVEDPLRPVVEKYIRTGHPFGGGVHGGSSPSGIIATADRVFVSNANHDSITVIQAKTGQIEKELQLAIPGLIEYRGILPIGLAYDTASGHLLVACAGINAVAVIDTKQWAVLAFLPTAWFPTRIAFREGQVWVSCAKGHGTGPNASRRGAEPDSFHGSRRRGSITSFPMPDADEFPKLTAQVFGANGFFPRKEPPRQLPSQIEHVVLIVKENRTFDEVLGDLEKASNGLVNGIPILARFGRYGRINNLRGELQTRLGLRNLNVTPNHHALAQRFAFSDNFYADSEVSVDGHHWLVGSYPNAWTESSLMASYGGQKDFRLSSAPGRLLFAESNSSLHPEEQLEAGALWHHLERHKITFRNYGEGFELAGSTEGGGLAPTGARFLTNVPMPDPLYRNTSRRYPGYNTNIPDQYRAKVFIEEIEELYAKPDKPLPGLLYIHLPNDHLARARPEDGYPFEASFMADNDYALGRIVEYLSHSKWWPKMAIFVTEDDAQGGVDHIDSHRTVLLVASPYAKKDYVSHVNASFPGILKTAFRLLKIPPLNLYDATAADLADCFTDEPDLAPYKALPVPSEVFEPENAKEAEGRSVPRMDDPNVLREQHRRQ